MGPYLNMGVSITNHVKHESNKHSNYHTNHETLSMPWNEKHANIKLGVRNDTKTNEGAFLVLQNMVVLSTKFPWVWSIQMIFF